MGDASQRTESAGAPASPATVAPNNPSIHKLLKIMIEKGASDLHLTAGSPPQIRIRGAIVPLRTDPLTPATTKQLVYSVLTDAQKAEFEEKRELDCSFGITGLSRFRANVYQQRGGVTAAIRVIPYRIPEPHELGLPATVVELTKRPRGLVIVTGPTGSGKSTSLASMINVINRDRHGVIVTIEDPIEYLHDHKNCIVNQREVPSDTNSFAGALKRILRQDPDVILIGEMRDLETIEAALRVSETGHLTLATLHTSSAVQSINRIIDVFPPTQQGQVRTQLSFVLEGVISQQLIPRADGNGRVLACEVLIPNEAIRNLVREHKIHQIYSQMQVGQSDHGMQTMNQTLRDLSHRGIITREDALRHAGNYNELVKMLEAM